MSRREWWGLWLVLALGMIVLSGPVVGIARTLVTFEVADLRSPWWWVRVLCACVFVGVAVRGWVKRWQALHVFLAGLGLVDGVPAVVLNVLPAVARLSADDSSLSVRPVVAFTLGLLQTAAAVGLLLSPAVRAYVRFRRTGLSDLSANASDTAPPIVFLSYRREDSREVVKQMSARLKGVFGADQVFLDLNDISPGSLFPDVLRERLAGANVVLVVIGPKWTTAVNATGRRLDDPTDWVRQEVEAALSGGGKVVPVLVSNAATPNRANLPETIRRLMDHQMATVRPDANFDGDMDALLETLIGQVPTVEFELSIDRPFDPTDADLVMNAQDVNNALVAAVAPRPLRIVGWHGPTYRVRCTAWVGTFEWIKEALKDGRLDSLTGVTWESVALVGGGAEAGHMIPPHQTPAALSDKCKEDSGGHSLVCHEAGIVLKRETRSGTKVIADFDAEGEEAKPFVGEPTTDPAQIRVYITRKWIRQEFVWVTYVHSNYVKPRVHHPTKIITTDRLSLFTLFLNLVYLEMPSGLELRRAEVRHREQVQYVVNEKMIGKGNAAFYCGASNVRFVGGSRRRWWEWWRKG